MGSQNGSLRLGKCVRSRALPVKKTVQKTNMRATFCNCDVGDSLLQTILDHRVFHIFLPQIPCQYPLIVPWWCWVYHDDPSDHDLFFWGTRIMVLRYLFARHNTQQFHIQGRARGVDIPSRCSEEIVDAAIVSARLITLHPNAEPSSITWIEAQIKTFGALTQTHLSDTWVHYAPHTLGEFLSIAVQIPLLITVTAA